MRGGWIKARVRVLLMDNRPIIFEHLKLLFTRCKRFHLLGMLPTPEHCLSYIRRAAPHVVIIEPVCQQGLGVIRELRAKVPKLKVVAFSANPKLAKPAFLAGADAFLDKSSSTQNLLLAMEVVIAGGIYLDGSSANLIRREMSEIQPPAFELSGRELEVAAMLVEGLTSKEIARKLNCETRHIDRMRAKMMSKMQVKNSAGLCSKLASILAKREQNGEWLTIANLLHLPNGSSPVSG